MVCKSGKCNVILQYLLIFFCALLQLPVFDPPYLIFQRIINHSLFPFLSALFRHCRFVFRPLRCPPARVGSTHLCVEPYHGCLGICSTPPSAGQRTFGFATLATLFPCQWRLDVWCHRASQRGGIIRAALGEWALGDSITSFADTCQQWEVYRLADTTLPSLPIHLWSTKTPTAARFSALYGRLHLAISWFIIWQHTSLLSYTFGVSCGAGVCRLSTTK